MAVYYKFKSEKKCNTILVDCPVVSVACIKERIFQSRYTKIGYDRDLEISNPQTNEVYLDDATLIAKNTYVLVRRIPALPRMRFVPHSHESKVESISKDLLPVKTIMSDDVSTVKDIEPSKLDDEFGDEIYAPFPLQAPVQASNAAQDGPAPSKDEEDSKIKALIETPALDWQRYASAGEGFGPGRGFKRGRMMAGCGFGRTGFEWNIPPQGYVCHRCNEPGHLIQHCPTNGDPDYDIKRLKFSTGIPKTMLVANPNGSYVLANGQVATVKPDEGAFVKETGRIPTTRSLGDLPPELCCPLCKEVMEYAVLTGKCCFKSFCDKCIRNYIISKSTCMCGAKDILADDLIPNKTLRDTIKRILDSSPNGSNDNAGSSFKLQDTESSRSPQPKSASPTQSATFNGTDAQPAPAKETPKPVETADKERSVDPPQPPTQQISDNLKTAKVPDISEATHEVVATEVKKKKRKAQSPLTAIDMQCRTPQDFPAERFMMPMFPAYEYNPYWTGFQPGMEGYMGSFGFRNSFNIGYGARPMAPNPLFPMVPPQREMPKDCDHGRKEISSVTSVDLSPMKPKSNTAPGSREASVDRSERDVDLPQRPSSNKRKSDTGRECSQDRDHHRRKRYQPCLPPQQEDCRRWKMIHG